ncbi:group II intron reverse transcriptase/maturase, partial [Limosilactobacillus reuteri]
MRQSQKTEQQADRLSRIGLENRKYTRARSTDYGEGKGMSVTIQDQVLDRNNLVLDRNNLNQAYLRVKRNKGAAGAAGIDDMTVNDLLPYLRENKTEFGFRPHRGAHDAIAKVVDLYNQGYRRVVDLDLKAY